MTAYIATKFENVDAFHEISKRLNDDLGITTVLDWTKHLPCKPFSDNMELCRTQAQEDIKAIQSSQIFIMYYDGTNKGSGMFLELGYAMAMMDMGAKADVIIFGKDVKNTSMFMHRDGITVLETLDEVIDIIKERM